MKKVFFLFFLALFSVQIYASAIKEFVIFGDSLSDDGNLYSVLKIVPKSPPYYEGRFSNGPVWAEYVANHFRDKFNAGYTNYAYGGATAILHRLVTDKFIAPVILEQEIDSYLLHSIRKDRSQTLFAIWIGANDYLYDKIFDINQLTDDVVNKTAWAIKTLINRGGKQFIVMNLPNLAASPYAKNEDLGRYGDITKMHNQKLATMVNDIRNSYPHINIIYMDIYGALNDFLAHVDEYNKKYDKHITNIVDACWAGSIFKIERSVLEKELQSVLNHKQQHLDTQVMADTIMLSPALAGAYYTGKTDTKLCTSPDEYIFWDDLHPTAVIHEVLGKIILETLYKKLV